MKSPEAAFIQAGYAYERAKTPSRARALAEHIRNLLEQEELKDQPEARRLIDRGRQEARQ